MKNYKDNDEDFKLVPMNMKGNQEYSFMPMNKFNSNSINFNPMINKHSNHSCCCMHNYITNPYPYSNNFYENQIFPQSHTDNIMVKTLITVKKKSDLFD
ncbi:hypothetical protein [Clostridium sp.]|uniref:hypothetical protein n=1 Tax=Clostridium sp. TaxID=1506 RepID=UPI002609A8A8